MRFRGNQKTGPSDEYLIVEGYDVEPDKNGNFIRKDYSEEELDAVHSFAVARLTIDLWEKAIGKKVTWAWSNEHLERKLKIVLHFDLVTAVFRKSEQSIIFGKLGNDLKYACKSIDLVSHETSHAVMEAFRPGVHDINTTDAFAIREALADLSSIFLMSSQKEILKRILIHASDDLSKKNMLSEFAPGYSFKENEGIRSALVVDKQPDDYYALSSFITNSGYKHLVRIWQSKLDRDDFQSSLINLISTIFRSFLDQKDLSFKKYLKNIKETLH